MVVDRGRFRTTPTGVGKWFTDVPSALIAMEAGTHSIWISEQLQELDHQVIVANLRELRAISHSDRKSDHADAEKLARFARCSILHAAFSESLLTGVLRRMSVRSISFESLPSGEFNGGMVPRMIIVTYFIKYPWNLSRISRSISSLDGAKP